MTDDASQVEQYAREFERHLAGSPRARKHATKELVEHLTDAAEAGELSAALDRLGGPESAAETFARERSAPAAPISTRLRAALIDNLPLIAVTLALFVQSLTRAAQEAEGFVATFPPFVYLKVGDACVALVPLQCGQANDNAGVLYALGVPLALAWSIIGLGILEALTGTTPGKRYRRLMVVTEAGLRVPVITAVARRLSFLAGPYAWLDWIPVLWGTRRRIADLLADTKVVMTDRANEGGVK